MPSLRIAVMNVGIVNIGLLFQPSLQHKPSDTVPINPSTMPNITPIRSTDTIPSSQMKFSTSTPTKSVAPILPVDLNLMERNVDTGSHSESSASIARTGSLSSIESDNIEDTDLFTMNTVIIEQFQILPERTWEYR